jgi:beta-phosphoglucomutase-like phosphatase (HAD superfamily)
MDGTLIDSEEFHWISWRNTLANEGIAITREQFLSSFGQRNDSIIPRWLGAAATPERIEKIANSKEELYRHLVHRHGITPLPGVANWVHRLHNEGWLQAIASAAPRANIDAVLEALVATHIFQGIVSAEDVHRGKPDPEVYLTAAARVRSITRQVHCCGRRRCRCRRSSSCWDEEHRGKPQRCAPAR